MSAKPIRVGLYRFFNWKVGQHGEPFALCEDCAKTQTVPEHCKLYLTAHDARDPCIRCGRTAGAAQAPLFDTRPEAL